MSRATRQKRGRDESFTISSPSTFRSSDFLLKSEKSSKVTNPSVPTFGNISAKKNKLNSEQKDLWNQVLNIRQLVTRMQANLNQLNCDVDNENADVNSHFDLSKEIDSFSSEDDSWNSVDEESIINLEGILVHVSSSETSSSSDHQDDASAAASSCVSSLGLGGHETTTPIHISQNLSKSIARGNLVSPVYSEGATPAAAAAARRRPLSSQADSEASSAVESLTTMQEFVHFSKIFYFFLLEFSIHFYSFLTDLSKNNTKTRSVARGREKSKRERKRWYLYIMLAWFIIGCVVWKQYPTNFNSSISRPSQSCVTPTMPTVPKNATTTTPTDFFAPPLLSVHHYTIRSKMSRPSRTISPSIQGTMQPFENTAAADDEIMDVSNNATEEIVVTSLDPQESTQDKATVAVPKNPLFEKLQSQSKKLIQKLAKNNHKMWNTYPSVVPPIPPPLPKQEVDSTRRKQVQLVSLMQEKGQEVLRKLIQNNHNMWDQYPTLLPQQNKGKEGGVGRFLQNTANMWSDKSSDYFLQ